MGNYRFRLSDMMPNAWLHKLRDMSKTRKHITSHPVKKKPPPKTTPPQKPRLSQPRKSYYYNSREPTRADKFYNSPTNPKASDTHFPDPSRKSSKKITKRKSIYKPSPRLVTSSVSECNSDSCRCRVDSSTTDIIIDMNDKSYTTEFEKLDAFDTISELQLPPILTKPSRRRSWEEIETRNSLSIKIVKQDSINIKTRKETKASPLIRKSSCTSTGLKLRVNSPRLASRKIQATGRRRSFLQSFAIVKSSFDPQKDFRDSMVEMIVENNIRSSKDLEELLACYLSLNSDEYHNLIVKAFEQICTSD
ncbi:hypothetical protein F0562_021588 [Nyssa sinensis]|uniref:Transcription repressor n=1 Tax=Nyssa sinensis TaxID=561372 RepID=A0A5J5BM05_9ASTE|nr:hypothetical protein F0562_021588 [Nyssa sinensis]